MGKPWLLSLVLLDVIAACAHSSPPRERHLDALSSGSTDFVLRYGAQDEDVARQVRSALRAAVPVAERWGALPALVTITIHPTHEALEQAARRPGRAWLRAWARRESIELQSPRTWSRGSASEADLAELLSHELTHCAMYQALGDDVALAGSVPPSSSSARAPEAEPGRGADPAARCYSSSQMWRRNSWSLSREPSAWLTTGIRSAIPGNFRASVGAAAIDVGRGPSAVGGVGYSTVLLAWPRAGPCMDLTNDFTWSKSRHEKFRECLRAYYYQYYGSWGGWEAPAGTPLRELYVLKKLSSRWQWAGSVVHESLRLLLERARRTGRFWTLDEVLERTRQRARREWSISREKSYWREASRIAGLVEHEYGEPVPGEEWKRIWDEVIEASLRGFYASESFARIQETPRERWLGVDELDSWRFEGTKVWVAVDFAFTDAQGVVHVVDWKTGREREVDHTQVGIYALYAQQKWGASPEGVAGELVYLAAPGAERVTVRADPPALEACRQEMRRSIGAMQERLEDPPRNLARLDRFPQLAEPTSCARCAFRRPCGRL